MKPLIILAGPTAVGKTDLSIQLAKQINGAIISADSMQVYKYMDIGSAKIMPQEMQGIDHYLIDELLPSDEFNIVRFQQMAEDALQKIYAKGQIPIVAGGTGFYIQALLYDISFTDQESDSAFRKEMTDYADIYGNHALHEKLREIDPVSYETIHENNRKRVIRALEYFHLTKTPISAHNEAEHQKVRLESIGLFEQLDFNPGKCPLCSGTLEHPLPSVEMIKASIANLDKSISNVTREQPKLRSFISELEQEREKKLEEIKGLQSEIDGIYQQEDERTHLRDINARRGKVIGRISLWIESVENDTESDKQEQIIKSIEDRIQEIDEILDADSVEDRKQSALSRIQENMTKWAKELELEHCDSPYRLDLNKVTVVVDKPDRPVPLKQLGSGSNWVGVHLIAYFALQYYFIGTNRPVPSFLFFDQPSQVYFPSELDEKNIDWNEVNKMYRFIVDRTSELEGKLQVIIVDHADLNNASFREYICENWWPIDKNLVPNDWYKKD